MRRRSGGTTLPEPLRRRSRRRNRSSGCARPNPGSAHRHFAVSSSSATPTTRRGCCSRPTRRFCCTWRAGPNCSAPCRWRSWAAGGRRRRAKRRRVPSARHCPSEAGPSFPASRRASTPRRMPAPFAPKAERSRSSAPESTSFIRVRTANSRRRSRVAGCWSASSRSARRRLHCISRSATASLPASRGARSWSRRRCVRDR